MTYQFRKYQGLGNDFVIMEEKDKEDSFYASLSQKICQRHYGVGGDGIILVGTQKKEPPLRMRIFNADGSEGEMCGNGLRCAVHYLLDTGRIDSKDSIAIDTLAGIIDSRIHKEEGSTIEVTAALGVPEFLPDAIPIASQKQSSSYTLTLHNDHYDISCVSTGPPHAVLFLNPSQEVDLPTLGPEIAAHPFFPKSCNVNVARVIDSEHVEAWVWERGVGITKACGTGAAAVAATGIVRGLLSHKVEIQQPGGKLTISWQGEGHTIFMTGPSTFVFSGVFPI